MKFAHLNYPEVFSSSKNFLVMLDILSIRRGAGTSYLNKGFPVSSPERFIRRLFSFAQQDISLFRSIVMYFTTLNESTVSTYAKFNIFCLEVVNNNWIVEKNFGFNHLI